MAYPFGRTNHNRAFANLWFADPLGDYVTNTIMYKKVAQLEGIAFRGAKPIPYVTHFIHGHNYK